MLGGYDGNIEVCEVKEVRKRLLGEVRTSVVTGRGAGRESGPGLGMISTEPEIP